MPPVMDLNFSKKNALPYDFWGLIPRDWRPTPEEGVTVFLQVLEKRGLAPLFSLARCLVLFRVPQKERARSPGSLQVIWPCRTRSAIRSHLRTRAVVLRYAARIMRPGKRCGCGAQCKRSPQSEGA